MKGFICQNLTGGEEENFDTTPPSANIKIHSVWNNGSFSVPGILQRGGLTGVDPENFRKGGRARWFGEQNPPVGSRCTAPVGRLGTKYITHTYISFISDKSW